MKPELVYIGQITTPYQRIEDCPRNVQEDGPVCEITLYDEYADGLVGLAPNQRILVLYWFENTDRTALLQQVDDPASEVGTFALRSPHRPNPIGAAELTVQKIEGGTITVRGLDCLNGTKLIDIKPAI